MNYWYLTIGITKYILNDEQAAMYKQAVADKLPAIELGNNLYSTNFQSLVSKRSVDMKKHLDARHWLCKHNTWHEDEAVESHCVYGDTPCLREDFYKNIDGVLDGKPLPVLLEASLQKQIKG